MQNPKLGDANFSMSTTCCKDHDWGDSSYDLENLFTSHDEYEIDSNVCNNIESGFGRVSTLDPTYLENIQSYEFFDKSGFGKVMALVNDNPNILEVCQLCTHVDHVENNLCDNYFVEFEYDHTCNYYEREKYGCRNFHVTKLPLVMLRLLLFLSSSLHMLVFALIICLLIRCLCIGSMLALDVFFTCYMMLSSCFNCYLSCEHHWNY